MIILWILRFAPIFGSTCVINPSFDDVNHQKLCGDGKVLQWKRQPEFSSRQSLIIAWKILQPRRHFETRLAYSLII